MSPKKRVDNTVPPLESLPSKLRMSLVRLMAADRLDVEQAMDRAATLIDTNSDLFIDEVKKEAQREYKSRFMKEMNSARSTFNKKANSNLLEGYDSGYDEGYSIAKEEFEIWYYCDVCGQKITVQPNSNSHQAIVNAMHEKNWGHQACHDKNKIK